jgi:murein DD-endopeptidase MepM/ murein hydrolase activator NlpD
MAVGAAVAAMEAGRVQQVISGKPHATGADCPSAQPNAIGIAVMKDGKPGLTTWYRHVTAKTGINGITVGKDVNAGDQIGTADLSGCTTGVHTHIELWSTPTVKNRLNFTITGCAGSGGTGTPFADAQEDPYDKNSFDD